MGKLLWQPSEQRIKASNMYRFMNAINERFGRNFTEYEALYRWSIQNIPDFWATLWDFAGVIASEPYEQVIDDLNKMPGAKWFTGARLNFAENLLRYRDDRLALAFKSEAQEAVYLTYAELYREVSRHLSNRPVCKPATGSWDSCPTCPRRSLPCWRQRAWAPSGLPARRTSA